MTSAWKPEFRAPSFGACCSTCVSTEWHRLLPVGHRRDATVGAWAMQVLAAIALVAALSACGPEQTDNRAAPSDHTPAGGMATVTKVSARIGIQGGTLAISAG